MWLFFMSLCVSTTATVTLLTQNVDFISYLFYFILFYFVTKIETSGDCLPSVQNFFFSKIRKRIKFSMRTVFGVFMTGPNNVQIFGISIPLVLKPGVGQSIASLAAPADKG